MVKNRVRLYAILFSVLYWTVTGFYLVIIRFVGLGEFAPPDLNYVDLALYAGIVGSSIGLLFGLFPISKLLRLQKRRSFLTLVLTGTTCYIVFFVSVIFLSSFAGNSIEFALGYVFSPDGLIVLFHLSMASLLYHFILQINKKFGPGVLVEYTLGKYFAPIEEERAFMFLDLKSSTRLAETLEHVTYSRLIQDCYAELTEPIIAHKAQVYQYVGDEVVLSWKMDEYFSAADCAAFFFAFKERLQSKHNYFLERYGIQPSFKAGAHCGTVTVAEVGEIKTEIAYHGDVLNTASRIQNLCNQFDRPFLISESLYKRLPKEYMTRAIYVTETALRGKETPIKLYTVSN
ncbi:MAG TPA: adenylate/guanylate cyclase domain-containing protein [Chryseosolibacter sp.]